MASDNDDREFKEDELDVAMKGHRRSAPPDDLLDRCLSTISSANRIMDIAPAAISTPAASSQKMAIGPLVQWMLAASVVIGTSGAYFFYDYQRRTSEAAKYARITQFAAHPEIGKGDADLTNGNRAPALFMSDGGITYQAEPGTSVADRSLANLQDESKPAIRDQQRNYEVDFLKEVDSAAIPLDAYTDSDPELKVRYPDPKRWEDLTIASLGVPFRTGGSTVDKEARKVALEEQVMRLREQVATTRREHEQEIKKEFKTEQSYVELKGSFETLEKRTAELRAHERELQQILESRGLPYTTPPNSESYTPVIDNPFLPVDKTPLSTFSTDVDTASYANVRRFLNQGTMPPRDAVRIEELINYFSYGYAQPQGADPFSVNLEVAGCPWNAEHRLVRIGLKGREIAEQQRPPASLVFLVDVSGSMQPANKLPLLKAAMKMLVQRLGENERVAIVTYSHELRLVLPSTTCDSKETITQALDSLQAAGSTNGAGGIQLAYQIAVENLIQGGVNRVILATDGDFNVGITDREELTRFIEEKARSGVFLSVLGFGMGNLKDATLERLADKGNGHYAYIDTIDEARKVLVDQLSGTLVTIAKDVKLQVEFNPRTVSAYRLIGYENRVMSAQDFNDDRKDAGDMGAGHTVTALYEVVPAGKSAGLPGIDPLKYQPDAKPAQSPRPELDDGRVGDARGELLTVKLRYKQPDGVQSKLMEVALTDSGRRYSEASTDFRFASAVAAFGMILRDSPHRGTATLAGVLELAEDGRGADREGYRSEFLKLVRQVQSIERK